MTENVQRNTKIREAVDLFQEAIEKATDYEPNVIRLYFTVSGDPSSNPLRRACKIGLQVDPNEVLAFFHAIGWELADIMAKCDDDCPASLAYQVQNAISNGIYEWFVKRITETGSGHL